MYPTLFITKDSHRNNVYICMRRYLQYISQMSDLSVSMRKRERGNKKRENAQVQQVKMVIQSLPWRQDLRSHKSCSSFFVLKMGIWGAVFSSSLTASSDMSHLSYLLTFPAFLLLQILSPSLFLLPSAFVLSPYLVA